MVHAPSSDDELPVPDPPTAEDVCRAAERLAGVAHRTPVVRSRLLADAFGCQLVLKCEHLQRTGAFKFRGAYNALSRLAPAQQRAGVITYSSGNHAQAVALAASLLDIPATIVMPTDAPTAKLDATRRYGGTIVTYDRYAEDREAIAAAIAADQGLTLVPPYDHRHIAAGQGTAARELFEEVGELDALVVPLGGGGLLSGSALAARAASPTCRVFGVEPASGDDGRQSLCAGTIVRIDTPSTIADGAQTQYLGTHTFPVVRDLVEDVLTVTDQELVDGMRLLATYTKMVVEPTGCLGLAGVRHLPASLHGARVGVVLSGGNVDLDRYAQLLTT